MPWKACKPVDERLKFIARSLDGEKMAGLCREFGMATSITRPADSNPSITPSDQKCYLCLRYKP
jgi:hypothetical protein